MTTHPIRPKSRRAQSRLATAPMARAIRAALVASAAALALSAPALALAGGKGADAPRATSACRTAATGTMIGTHLPVDDPSIVTGCVPPASVTAQAVSGGLATSSLADIAITGYGSVTGIVVQDADEADVSNDEVVDVVATGGAGDASAYAVSSLSGHFATLSNGASGDISASAASDGGNAMAVGAYASGWNATTLTNDGAISADADSVAGNASAYAAVVYGGPAGTGLMINGGEMNADASAGGYGAAQATAALVYSDVASFFNDASASATAAAGAGDADATGAHVGGSYSALYNYGSIEAQATSGSASASAIGAETYAYFSSTFYNGGDIGAIASSGDGDAYAAGASSVARYGGYADNTGSIAAAASGAQATAVGIANVSYLYALSTNEGSIEAVADGTLAPYGEYEAVATGLYNVSVIYDSIVDNTGAIAASATAIADIDGGDGFLVAKSVGARAINVSGLGGAVIQNGGTISGSSTTSQGYAGAWGAASEAGYGGLALIDNDGSIGADANTDVGSADTFGAYARSVGGEAAIINHGDISADSRAERGIRYVAVDYAYATGAKAFSLAYGSGSQASLDNEGGISAHASVEGGIAYSTGAQVYGAQASVHNAAGAAITAVSQADLFGGAFATALNAGGVYDVTVVNDGTLSAYGHASDYSTYYGASRALGVYAAAGMQGDASIVNNGDVMAHAVAEDGVTFFAAGAGAVGLKTYAKYDGIIENTGDVAAIAQSDLGVVAAYGAVDHGKYYSHVVNASGATILASATVGTLGSDQYAGRAATFGTEIFGAKHAVSYNAGSIVSEATVLPEGGVHEGPSIATAYGSFVEATFDGDLVNSGHIEASASADYGYASAYGGFVDDGYLGATHNAGTLAATARADHGNAFAVGSYTHALATQYLGCDYDGCHYAVVGGDAVAENAGDISAAARAHGGIGASYGIVAIGARSAGVANAGDVVARTDADSALAVGVIANSFYGDATVTNGGTIAAAAYGADATAIGVQLASSANAILDNSGRILALGDGERIAVSSGDTATASIANSGTIVGAIRTGNLDDSFDNAAGGTWQAIGDSGFGAGDDRLVNHGAIVMDDASILLGEAVAGNAFSNFGTLSASGDDTIDMGGAFAFGNDGLLRLADGIAGDALTIAGGLSGNGAIALDASPAGGTSDRVTIDGDVAATATQAIDVNLLDLPNAASTALPLVYVTGASGANNFTLGNVGYAADGFLTFGFGLGSGGEGIAGARAVSLDVEVTGLNDMGSLAASIAPAVQGLVAAQTGTWRARTGDGPRAGESGPTPWVRAFSSSGDIALAGTGSFGGDSIGLRQSSHGWELGLDARFSDRIAVGVLFGASDGEQRLRDGQGSNRLDAHTFGLYATWTGQRGSYLDLSQRWIGAKAELQAATGSHRTKASASAFNLEAGFTAWTVADARFVPQLQYTRSRVGDIAPIEGSQSSFAAGAGTSSRGRLGIGIERSFASGSVEWTPHASMSVVREFDGGYGYSINQGLSGETSAEGTGGMVELGIAGRAGRLSFSAGVDWIDGGAADGTLTSQATLRYRW
jgi:outer membrane autotransporter protein